MACGGSKLRGTLARKGILTDGGCRHGCNAVESMDHVLLSWPAYRGVRDQIFEICKREGVEPTLQSFMIDERLQKIVERLFISVGLCTALRTH